MVRSLLSALAVVTLLSGALIGECAGAKFAMQPPASRAAGSAGLVKMAVNICGNAGCVAVQTRRLTKHQLPKTTQPQSTAHPVS
jgi:hypothetical protein